MRLSFQSFDRFSSSELLNMRFLDKGKFRQNFWTSFFFWLFSSEPTNISRRENSRQKSKHRFSPGNFLLTYISTDESETRSNFPTKVYTAYYSLPSSGRCFLSILTCLINCRTANFSTSKNSVKSLNVVFLPTMHFLLNRWTFSGRCHIFAHKKCNVFINF